ncbi:mitochondrial ribosomal protein subunit L22 [Trichophyton benhamiae CBS 112371]|uniref:Mitochondrial ribosomal protein subunit L22 n=1 Tax=Arthroderma benhamiae (strain ATCC MYA-4681 / CBS 112371) TaxID=663331 RepID=D4B4V8_ARTBC|nr:mitochondrial ribosomal protein subunit L22 [Trichophyton benhamiae CBS 112371]EFE29603.1 mitochondrial ribosomal protein subunit L22 [Trichophyton benhamiae CBS 112371]
MSSTAHLHFLRESLMGSNSNSNDDKVERFSSADLSSARISHRPPAVKKGSLGTGSIFSDGEVSTSGPTPKRPLKKEGEDGATQDAEHSTALVDRNRDTISRTLIPHPERRARWERKMVIRAVKNRGQLTREEVIQQSERELQSRSHWFKTSVKKLGPLARQIAGKKVEDAIMQMRYSKKKAARDVLAFLEQARNEAIVSRGMGIKSEENKGQEVEIKLKDGKRYTVRDEREIYVDQAWVNRGPYGVDFDHRARGQINRLRPPYTALAVVLKEEKTRVREWQDRTEKALRERREKLWVQMPDRRVTGQSQYYSW